MPYQHPYGKSRFYINILEWLDFSGHTLSYFNNTYRTLPVGNFNTALLYSNVKREVPKYMFNDKSFVAILNMASSKKFELLKNDFSVTFSNIVNISQYDGSWNYPVLDVSGWGIASFDGSDTNAIQFGVQNATTIGSAVIGTYMDMPSPSQITISRQLDGIKRTRTKGGTDLIHTQHNSQPPQWGSRPAWDLGSFSYANAYEGHTNNYLKVGRRVFDLTYDSLRGSQLFPKYNAIKAYDTEDDVGDLGDFTEYAAQQTLIGSKDFTTQVLNRVGNNLPFIFNLEGGGDSPNNNHDLFAIVVLDQKSINIKSVANGIYSLKIRLKEVW